MARSRKSKYERSPLAKAVGELRVAMGLTQQEFANVMGVTPTTIARWETHREPSIEYLPRLSYLLRKTGSKGLNPFHDALEAQMGLGRLAEGNALLLSMTLTDFVGGIQKLATFALRRLEEAERGDPFSLAVAAETLQVIVKSCESEMRKGGVPSE